MQESQRLVTSVSQILAKVEAPGAADFKKLASSMIRVETPSPILSQHSMTSMGAPQSTQSTPSPSTTRQQLRPQTYRQHSASISDSDLLSQQEKLRRATVPHIPLYRHDYTQHGRTSLDTTRSESPMSRREYNSATSTIPTVLSRRSTDNDKPPNLDYLSLSNTPVPSQPQSPVQSRKQPPMQTQNHNSSYLNSLYHRPTYSGKTSGASPSEWEVLLGSLDGGQTNLYDAIYGGPALSLSDATVSTYGAWSPDNSWDMASLNMGDFTSAPGAPRSVLSFSEESLSSGEDMSTSELGLSTSIIGDYGASLVPGSIGSNDSYLLESMENTFGL